MKQQLIRAAAATVLGVGLTTGLAAAQSGTISNTGPQSRNAVTASSYNSATIHNTNTAGVNNDNDQGASSGSTDVRDNTTGGDAMSGDVSLTNGATTSYTVTNDSGVASLDSMSTGDPSGSIDTTGPQSTNTVNSTDVNTLNVTNNNSASVNNENSQHANSGSANVSDNTTGGNAQSGSVTLGNTSDTTLDFSN